MDIATATTADLIAWYDALPMTGTDAPTDQAYAVYEQLDTRAANGDATADAWSVG